MKHLIRIKKGLPLQDRRANGMARFAPGEVVAAFRDKELAESYAKFRRASTCELVPDDELPTYGVRTPSGVKEHNDPVAAIAHYENAAAKYGVDDVWISKKPQKPKIPERLARLQHDGIPGIHCDLRSLLKEDSASYYLEISVGSKVGQTLLYNLLKNLYGPDYFNYKYLDGNTVRIFDPTEAR